MPHAVVLVVVDFGAPTGGDAKPTALFKGFLNGSYVGSLC